MRRASTPAQRALFARLCLLASIALFCPGCALGLLVVGGVVTGVVLTSDDGSSSPARVRSSPFLSPPPSRDALRAQGNASLVPVCFQGGGDGDDIRVEFSVQREDAPVWRRASRSSSKDPASFCSGARTFWWDAAADLELPADVSEVVRVRVYSASDPDIASISPAFAVGNTPGVLELVPLGEATGTVLLSAIARDAEGDPILGAILEHEARPELGCPEASDEQIRANQPFGPELAAPEIGRRHSGPWDSTLATCSHNVKGLRLRLSAQDHFGAPIQGALSIDLRNNSRPEARLLADSSDLSASFTVPIPFKALDTDSHPVDLIVQYAFANEPFETLGSDLPPECDREGAFEDASFRRWLLEAPEAAACRRALRVATPLVSSVPARRWLGLPTTPGGTDYTFVWDASTDVPPATATNVRLRITPFDEDRGFAAETPGDLLVDNDAFPSAERLVEGLGPVTGTAIGDLDGDARPDVALSLREAPSQPGEPDCEQDHGRVDVFFRARDGSLENAALTLVPGSPAAGRPCPRRERGPLDLIITDVDGDERNDLVALGSRCGVQNCKGVRGEISIFFGSSSVPPLSRVPEVVLDAGADVRALGVGDFDGDQRLDLAVSNHDNADGPPRIPRGVGVFRQTAHRQFTEMSAYNDCEEESCEPGLLVCADLTDDGHDDIAVRQDEPPRNRVLVLRWSADEAALRLATTAELGRLDPDFLAFNPVSLGAFDFNSDGRPELVVGSRETSSLFVLESDVEGRFVNIQKTCLSSSPERLGLVDVTGDGRPEALALEPNLLGGTVELVQLRVDGCCPKPCTFKQVQIPLPGPGGSGLAPVSTGDLNQDGRPDILLGSVESAHLLVAAGAGSFSRDRESVLSVDPARQLRDFVVVDLNSDGLLDLALLAAVRERANDHYELLLFHQSRRGEFSALPSRVLESHPGPGCVFQPQLLLAEADLDSDGSSDVLAISRDGGVDVFWRGNDGFTNARSGTLETCGDGALPGGPVALGRFGGSAQVDLLRLSSLSRPDSPGGRLILTSLELKDGVSGPELVGHDEPPLLTESPALSMAQGDFNLDGLDDIVLLHPFQSRFTILVQDPGRTWPERFRAEASTPTTARTGTLLPADLDSDGRLDLLVLPGKGETVLAYLQAPPGETGPIQFQQRLELEPGGRIAGAGIADLNGDGRIDVAVGVSGEDSCRLFFQGEGSRLPRLSSWFTKATHALSSDSRIVAKDVTGDGTPDLILFHPTLSQVEIMEAR